MNCLAYLVEMQLVIEKKRSREAELPLSNPKKAKSAARQLEPAEVGLDDADSVCFLCKFGGRLVVW